MVVHLIVQEDYKALNVANDGDITDVRVTREGYGYTELPTITITSSGGKQWYCKSERY